MHKPIHLKRLPVSLRFMCRHNTAVMGDLQKLLFADHILFFFCQLQSIRMIPTAQEDHCITGNVHSAKLIFFIQRLRIPAVVQIPHGLLYLVLIVKETVLINILRTHRVARASLFHEFRKYAALIGFLPFRSHFIQYSMPDRTSLPKRYHFFFLKSIVLLSHLKADQFPVIHHMEVLHCMAAQLRKGGRSLRPVPLFSHQQFTFTDVQCFFGKIML